MKTVPSAYATKIFEVLTVPDYRKYVKAGVYFLVTDSTGTQTIHSVDCEHYGYSGIDSFKEKVVEHNRRQGQYFYSNDIVALCKAFPNAVRSQNC